MRLRGLSLSLALLAVTGAVRADSPITNDAWDISNGTSILGHSSFDNEIGQGYDARDVFGGNFTLFPTETGDVVFDDLSPINAVDFIEWRTSTPVTISTFKLFYKSDDSPSGPISNRRSLGHFALFERASPVAPWVSLYSADTPLVGPMISGSVAAFLATDFRAEFIRAASNQVEYTGSRIVELDGFSVPEPGSAAFLGIAFIKLISRGRQRRFTCTL